MSWADNSGRGDALATDNAMLLVYNPSKNQSVYTTSVAVRSDRTASLVLPSEWGSDDVEAYMAMYRESTNETSPSYYLGSFTL